MRFNSILKRFLNKNLNGGALYIAIMVGVIVSVLMAMFVLLSQFNLKQVTQLTQNAQLHVNLKSALELAKSKYFLENWNNVWVKNQINDDSLKVNHKFWGAYTLLSIQTKNRHRSLSFVGLYGAQMSLDTGLVVSENNRPVGLSGSIALKANCYLSSKGVKPAFIEGYSFMGMAQNAAFLKHSPAHIPEIARNFTEGVKLQADNPISNNDTLLSIIPTYFERSFAKSTVVIEAGGILSKVRLKNNIKIISKDEIQVDSTCHLENVLILAKKVRFKEGFKGIVHVIATDSIITGKNGSFNYPSSFVLFSEQSSTNFIKSIQLGENNVFYGGLIAMSEIMDGPQNVYVKLNSTSEVNGLIYSSGYLHVQGKLNANTFCDRLLLKTPSAVYENHILTCEINPAKYGSLLSVPILFNNEGHLTLSKALGG